MSRIVFEVSDEQMSEIEMLVKETSVSTKKDLFNNALTFLKWALKEKKEGSSIGSLRGNDSYKEIIMPILDSVKHG